MSETKCYQGRLEVSGTRIRKESGEGFASTTYGLFSVENEANAAEIAHHWNSFEEMREALEEAISLCHTPEHAQDDEWNERFKKVQATLARATKGAK